MKESFKAFVFKYWTDAFGRVFEKFNKILLSGNGSKFHFLD